MSLCLEYCPVREERVFLYDARTGSPGNGYFLSHPTEPARKACFPAEETASAKLSAKGRTALAELRERRAATQVVGDIGGAWHTVLLQSGSSPPRRSELRPPATR